MNAGLVDDLMVHLARSDRRAAADQCVSLIESGLPLATLVDEGLAPAMERVGSMWESATWTVADEHLATAAAEAALSAAAAECRPQDRRGEVVVACVEGDWHSLPSRMLAEVLVVEGWAVRFLGASQPTPLLVDHLARFRPDAVMLSCAVPMALPELAVATRLLHELDIPVFAGGRGLGPGAARARELGLDGWAADVAGALRLLEDPQISRDPVPVQDALVTYRQRQRMLAEWVLDAMDRLCILMPVVASYPPETWERTRVDLEHLLDVTALSLLVADPLLLDEQCAWLQGLLDARGVPGSALALGIQALLDTSPPPEIAEEETQLLGQALEHLLDGAASSIR